MASLVYIAVICVLLCIAFYGLDRATGQSCENGYTTKVAQFKKCDVWICDGGHWEFQRKECLRDRRCYPHGTVLRFHGKQWRCTVFRNSDVVKWGLLVQS
ncbi:hypothetical protein PoB_007090800 [Plakobranchus ocellatus]|uniref:Uncharacterized protein n=1 Tax=Plakobranchus ocellatus TaxID=259542 RepID=A0AAV4DJE1_9GAST|nr:hypothetical protein PoB_007090800 [Plakobranchus ocellatus]